MYFPYQSQYPYASYNPYAYQRPAAPYIPYQQPRINPYPNLGSFTSRVLPYQQPYVPAPQISPQYVPQVPQVPQYRPQYPYPGYPPIPMQSQIQLASPQKNFQSPDRLRSPQKNVLMHSQQQLPRAPTQAQLQSPTTQKYLTYEEVQQRIRQQNQGQQGIQKPAPQQAPAAPVKKPQPQQKPQANPPPIDDLEARYQQAIKNTKKIVEENSKKNPKPESGQKYDDADDLSEQQEELALQYEDGYIYRGQGIPPQTREGFGILTDDKEVEVYSGYWKDNFYHGQGKLNNLQKEELDGPLDWNNMTSIGNGWLSYEGNFVAGKMHGLGTLILVNGEKYTGEFDEGMVHGEGEFTTLDGQVVKGQWDQGFMVQVQE